MVHVYNPDMKVVQVGGSVQGRPLLNGEFQATRRLKNDIVGVGAKLGMEDR